MKLGKLVAKGVAEDVLDATVEEPSPASAPEPETTEADTAPPFTAQPLPAESVGVQSVAAGSSTLR